MNLTLLNCYTHLLACKLLIYKYKINNKYIDKHGNYIIADIHLEDKRFKIASIYGPNSDEPAFYVDMFNKIDVIKNDSYIICGDLNLIQDPLLD